VLIILGVSWVASGQPLEIQFSVGSLIPPLGNLQNLVFLTGMFLAFAGLEVSAVHAREVQDPQKTFPRAIVIAAVSALIIYAVGALAIAIMIPKENISLIAGLIDAFTLFLAHFHLGWLTIPLGIMIVFGAVGELNAWIIGPVRALHATSKHGDLPPIFQKLNKHGMPVPLLVFQGLIVTVFSFIFLFMPSASSAFWILSAISAQLYLVMYVLMFLAAIKLRYSHPHIVRTYRIPYRMPGIWFVGSLGALSSLFAFCIGFVPPGQIQVGNLFFYEGFLFVGIFLMALIPFLIFKFRKPSWHPQSEED
jgi:amino acid transporter